MKSLGPALLVGALLSGPAMAQQKTDDHSAHHPAGTATTATSTADMADGEVRKVDRDAGKLTLKHGELRNLDMPGMTMVFKVANPKMLDAVKTGDKVKFAADNVNGTLTVTAIEVAK